MAEPNIAELAKDLADTKQLVIAGQTALNIVWTLVTGFLVMFMQAGFAMLETGMTRAKNVAHTMGMNFLVYSSRDPRVLGDGLRVADGRHGIRSGPSGMIRRSGTR